MKTFNVKIRSTGQHGRYGKEVFRVIEITANTKKEAIELAKQEMFKTTYFEFFPTFQKYEENHLDWNMYSIREVLKTRIYEGLNQYGCPMYSYVSNEDLEVQVHSLIKEDILERVEVVA